MRPTTPVKWVRVTGDLVGGKAGFRVQVQGSGVTGDLFEGYLVQGHRAPGPMEGRGGALVLIDL